MGNYLPSSFKFRDDTHPDSSDHEIRISTCNPRKMVKIMDDHCRIMEEGNERSFHSHLYKECRLILSYYEGYWPCIGHCRCIIGNINDIEKTLTFYKLNKKGELDMNWLPVTISRFEFSKFFVPVYIREDDDDDEKR